MNRRALILAAPAALAAGSASAAEGSKGGRRDTFVRLATLTTNLSRPGGRRGVLTVEAGVDAPDPATHARVVAATPRLRDAFAEEVRAFGFAYLPGSVPNVERLSASLQAATDRVIGRKGAILLLGGVIVS